MSKLYIVQYTPDKADVWNAFIQNTNNGTFLFNRQYMDYHQDRFKDQSLMLYKGTSLIAIFPASVHNDTVISHGGLSYGGLITDQLSGHLTRDLIEAILLRLSNYRIVWKPIPHIFHKVPSESEEYWLQQMGFNLIQSYVSQYRTLHPLHTIHKHKQQCINKSYQYNLYIDNDINKLPMFWEILTENLKERHNTKPTHSLEEMLLLHQRFPMNIKLYTMLHKNTVVAGMLIYLTPKVDHVQYMAVTSEGKTLHALDRLVYDYISHYQTTRILNFGISNERDGTLNQGLYNWKSEFGCVDTLYNIYQWREA